MLIYTHSLLAMCYKTYEDEIKILNILMCMQILLLQLMSALRSGSISNSRFALATDMLNRKEKIAVERSGGGV